MGPMASASLRLAAAATRQYIRYLHSTYIILAANIRINRSSAVAEMGDSLATIDTVRKVGAAVPLSVGESWVRIYHNVA